MPRKNHSISVEGTLWLFYDVRDMLDEDYLYYLEEALSMWALFGGCAIITAILNVVWYFRKKNSERFRFSSVSLTALTMCAFYNQSSQWVIAEDWSALMDVIPSMSTALWVLVIASIMINGITLIKRK